MARPRGDSTITIDDTLLCQVKARVEAEKSKGNTQGIFKSAKAFVDQAVRAHLDMEGSALESHALKASLDEAIVLARKMEELQRKEVEELTRANDEAAALSAMTARCT